MYTCPLTFRGQIVHEHDTDQLLVHKVIDSCLTVERGSSVVECRTRNRESPGSNPRCYRLEVWAFSFSSRRLSRLSCIDEYLAIDSVGHVSDLVVARNCCMTRMLT